MIKVMFTGSGNGTVINLDDSVAEILINKGVGVAAESAPLPPNPKKSPAPKPVEK